ncbi:O-antigen ligase family protein [Candidatus Falkowbacteria bacterium]|nr:O-antigen ligase family protein [Candidatus Falkowbacteria bacterium]
MIKITSAVALFFVVLNIKFNWKKLLLVFILSATLQSGFGLWQFFNQDIPANKYLGISAHNPLELGVSVIQTEERRWLRSYGGQAHPNILGGYLVIALFFAINLYLKVNKKEEQNKKDLYTRLFLLVSLIILFSGLLTTFSRSAWLVFGMGFIFFIIFNFRKNIQALSKILFLFLIITSFFIFNFKEIFLPRFTINNRLEIQSIEERIDYTTQAKNLIKDNQIKGFGVGNYTIANYNKLKKDMPAWYFQPVHNTYLLILTELGIIGLILFLSFIIMLLRKRNLKNNIFFIATCSLLIIMFFDHWLWSSHFGLLLLFLILGLFIKISQKINTVVK